MAVRSTAAVAAAAMLAAVIVLVISGREDSSVVKEGVIAEDDFKAAIPTMEVEVPYKLSSLVPPKAAPEAMSNWASAKRAELQNQVPPAEEDVPAEATELVSEKLEVEMHKMPDGSWMPGADHEHSMHKMSDGSWMRGVSHADAIADTSVPTSTLVGEVQMHQMPDGSWMPGVSHKQAVHKMPDGSWMHGMTHEDAQAMELTAKEHVQSNPAAAAGVSAGPIVNPKTLVNALSPKKTAAKAVAPAHKLGVSTAAAVDVVKAKVRTAARHAAKQAAKKAVKLGLSPKKAQAMVRKAAKKAAKTAAKTSHSVYMHALHSQKVPVNTARDAARIRKQELSTKVVLKKQRVTKLKKMQAVEIARKKKVHSHSELTLKAATKRTLAVATADEKKKLAKKALPSAVTEAVDMKKAQQKALSAESKAWRSAVQRRMTKKAIQSNVAGYMKKYKVSMAKAAAMWEAHQVNHMKSRFAKHYSHALDKKKGTKREKALEKVNAQKLVIARAEMQSIIAQHNDEKLTKSELRTKTALNRVKASSSETLQKHLAVAKEATKRADGVQTKAFAAILAKDAASKEKALSKVNAAQATAKRAEASKANALKALIVARNKLSALSAKATHGSAVLSKKLKAQVKAQAHMMKHQLQEVKKETVKSTKTKMKKANAQSVRSKVAAIKLKLAKSFKAKAQHAQNEASKVATQAQKATISATKLAKREEKVAASAVARGRERATKATKRAAAVKSMAAQQMATLAKQKQLALRHFAKYNKRLKTLENEKSAKAQAKIDAKQEAVHQSQEAAARVARFAQTQMDNLEVEKSKIAIGKAATAGEVLKNAIYQVKTADRRAHGDAVLEMEKQAALAKRKRALEKKQKALAKAKEAHAKLKAKAKEFKAKARAKKKERHAKKIANEKRKKHAKIVKEGFTKGVKFAREKHTKRAVAALKIKEKAQKKLTAEKIKKLAAKSAVKAKHKAKTPSLTKSLKAEAKALVTAAVGKVSAKQLQRYTHIVEGKLNRYMASRKTKTPAQIQSAAVAAVKEAVTAVKHGPKKKSKAAKAVHKAAKAVHKAAKASAVHHKKAKAASAAAVKASKTAVKASSAAVKAAKTATKAAHTVTKVAHAAAKATKSLSKAAPHK